MFIGMIIKIVYAFLWQEQYMPFMIPYYNPTTLFLADFFLPVVNSLADSIS
jgi:hypothetical protein